MRRSRWRVPRHPRDGLALRGIQSYSGNLQHIPERAERQRRAQEQRGILRRVIQQVREAGIAVEIVTGAGTGTYDLDSEDGPFTELQVGSYVFMDVDYQRAMLDGCNTPRVRNRAVRLHRGRERERDRLCHHRCRAEVLRHRWPGAGGRGRCACRAAATSSSATSMASSILPDGAAKPPIGARIECVTPHCDPTVNLHDAYHVVRGDTLIDIWPVDARGKR